MPFNRVVPIESLDATVSAEGEDQNNYCSETSAEEEKKSDDISPRVKTAGAIIIHITTAVIIISLLFYIWFISFTAEYGLILWHPICMTLGAMGCTPGAIMTLSYYSMLRFKLSQGRRVRVHYLLQISSTLLVISGFICIYVVHERVKMKHISTLHGKIGIITIVMQIVSLPTGILAYNALQLRTWVKMVYIKALHNVIGLFIVTFQLISLIIGMNTPQFRDMATSNGQFICIFLILTIYLCSNIFAVRSAFFRVRRIMRY